MRRRIAKHMGVLLVYLLMAGVASAKPARAPDPPRSFDDLFAEAEPVTDMTRLVDPLFDTCDKSDAVGFRVCEGARVFLENDTRKKIYTAVGDTAALTVNPYDAAMKELDIDVQGCLACVQPLQLSDAKGVLVRRFVTTQVPRAIKAGHAVGLDVATVQLSFHNAEQEAQWKHREQKVVPRLRVQFVFKLGDPWSSGSFSGLRFVPLAYRVFDACTGEVFSTSPALADGVKPKSVLPVLLSKGDVLQCPTGGAELSEAELAAAKLPMTLSREEIEHAMGEVQERVHECHVEFEESGTVQVRLVLEGASGRVKEAQIYPPFDKTSAGVCVRAAMRGAVFPHFRSETQQVKVPVSLR